MSSLETKMRAVEMVGATSHQQSLRCTRCGVAYGMAAYLWFGLAVFYYKAVSHVPVCEVLAHRVLWTPLVLVGLLAARRRLCRSLRSLRDRGIVITLVATSGLIGLNWYVYIWAIAHDRVIETSLGYYINPLVNVLTGFLFLHERLRSAQAVSVLLATLGVLVLGISYGRIPFVSLALAFFSGFYGLLRKRVQVDGSVGIAVEMTFMAPLALLYLGYLGITGELVFARANRSTDLLLLAAGVVSATPLVWFINAAKRLRYGSLGLMMYVMPTITFLIAVFVFREPFGKPQLVSFCLIWTALLIYASDSVLYGRRSHNTAAITVRG